MSSSFVFAAQEHIKKEEILYNEIGFFYGVNSYENNTHNVWLASFDIIRFDENVNNKVLLGAMGSEFIGINELTYRYFLNDKFSLEAGISAGYNHDDFNMGYSYGLIYRYNRHFDFSLSNRSIGAFLGESSNIMLFGITSMF